MGLKTCNLTHTCTHLSVAWRLGRVQDPMNLIPLSPFLSRSNKAVCSRYPLHPIERDQPVDFKGVATRSPQDTAVSESTVSGLRHLTSPPFRPLSLSRASATAASLTLLLSLSQYNDISEIKMDYGAFLSCHSLGLYSTMSCYC